MNMVSVESSNLKKVGYEDNKLFLEYGSGAIYEYTDVPIKLYEELLTSE